MENRQRTEAIASKFESSIGSHFDPQTFAANKAGIIETLTAHLPDHSRNEIERVVELSFNQVQQKIRWFDFLQIISWYLPGYWVKLNNSPGINASTMLLLTDGSVLCQDSGSVNWKRLVPDDKGSYVNGSFHNVAPMHNSRLYYTSAVLADGRVLVSGGEYSSAGSETNATEIYNPVTNTWTVLSPPPGWSRVGDAACCVLADGRVLMGNLDDTRTALFDPFTNTWLAGPAKGTSSSEESWTLLADGSVLTVRCNSSQRAEKYIPSTNSWVSAGTTPVNLVEVASSEIGAAITLNDGRAFFIGATGRTALYTSPANPSEPGSWTTGPDFPAGPSGQTIGCKDSPSCLLTNGKVLISAGPVDGIRGDYLKPTYFYEFNGSSIYRVTDPPNHNNEPYQGRMLLLPNGQVLFASASNEIYAYTYFAWIDPASRPSIISAPSNVHSFGTYSLYGRQLNGLSQAVGYGDDSSSATNYPIVRIRFAGSGNVYYCRTFDHSTMGIATGNTVQHTTFAVPFFIEQGDAQISVIANGISSMPFPVYVRSLFPWWTFNERMVNHLIGSLADGPLWVLGPNGPVPVDPWGPRYEKLARASWQKIFEGVGELQKLGAQVEKQQLADAKGIPVAVDTGDEDEDEEGGKSITGIKMKKGKEVLAK